MSLSHSPKIVTSGLVFAYDMGNGKKSWKGAPTTNLITASLSGMQGVSLTFLSLDNGWKKYAMSGTFTAGTYPYTMNMTSTSYTGGVTYSSSCFIKTNVAYKFNYFGTGMNYVNQAMTKAGTSFSIAQPDGSLYVGRSNFAYTATTTQVGYLLTNPINNTTFNASTDFVWFKNGQVELGEFPTSFAGDSTTRSNTQALLDWAGNNTVTASSLTYNSDGTFSFNGSNTYASFLTPITETGSYTVIQWLRPSNALLSGGSGANKPSGTNRRTSLVGPGPVWNPGIWMTSDYIRVHAKTQYRDAAINWTTTDWKMIGMTYDGTNCQIIFDGEFLPIAFTTSASFAIATTMYLGAETSGGSGINWLGDIGITQMYNRILTAAEVAQNFNALRGRYGI